jgi:hypothetical protein
MMKIKADFRGRPSLILGLSHANLDKLRADGLDGHIHIDGKEMGCDHDIYITAAATEGDMLRAFQDGIQEGTKLHISEKLKS